MINLTGYSHEYLLGKNLGEIGFFRETPVEEQFFAELVKTGYILCNDIPLETKDGRIIDVEFVSERYSFDRTGYPVFGIRYLRPQADRKCPDPCQKKSQYVFEHDETRYPESTDGRQWLSGTRFLWIAGT